MRTAGIRLPQHTPVDLGRPIRPPGSEVHRLEVQTSAEKEASRLNKVSNTLKTVTLTLTLTLALALTLALTSG